MLMDIRCAFVLLVALAAMPCQAKPTEGAQPSVKGAEVEIIPVPVPELEAEELVALTAEPSAVTEATTDSSSSVEATTNSSSNVVDVQVTEIELTTPESQINVTTEYSADAEVTTDFSADIELTTHSEIEFTTDLSAGIGIRFDRFLEIQLITDSALEVTTDSSAGMEVTTDTSAGIEMTTDSEIEVNTGSDIEVTTDSFTEIDIKIRTSSRNQIKSISRCDPAAKIQDTTDPSVEVEVTTYPSTGIEVTTDSMSGTEVTTDPSASEIEVTTISFDVEANLLEATTLPEEEMETVTPIVFPEGPEATTFLAEANYYDEGLVMTTESLILETTTDSSEYAATTDYPDFGTPVKIPARYKQSKRKNYEGYRVLRVLLVTDEAIARTLRLEDVPGVTFWADPKLLLRPRGRFVTSAADIMVSPQALPAVEDIFRQGRLTYTVLIDNVQEAIANENIALSPFARSQVDGDIGHKMTWQRYHRLSDIDSFLVYLEQTYPDLVDVIEIGQSSQGRPIKLVKMGRKIKEARAENKKSILIDAGVHGNEWITTSSVTWMLNELSSNSDRYDCILERFDWLWIPLLNPDGYEYAHTVDRMWRKTRRNYTSLLTKSRQGTIVQPIDPTSNEDDCVGADINRNFEFYWRKGGSSSNVCSTSFAGIFPFSEPESRALANYVLKHKKDIAMYISLHAYSQMWLLPWGFSEERPKDFGRLFSLAKIGATALQRVHNTSFLIGSVPDLLYRSSGNSQDWVKAVAGVDYSYTVEMRDAGESGRILPSKEIVDSSEETWAGIYATGRELAIRLYPYLPECPAF